MSLLSIIIALVIAGIILWAINSFIPMDAKIKKLLNIVVVVFLVIWLLVQVGAIAHIQSIHF